MPVFRDEGFFILLSQFQDPCHFLLCYLEDYKMDPARANPLLTFSAFDDFATSKDITLVRADIINQGLEDDEGYKVVKQLMDMYLNDDDYATVHAFNKQPDSFDFDDFVSQQNAKWKSDDDDNTTTTTTSTTKE